jgi:hypothetical protein
MLTKLSLTAPQNITDEDAGSYFSDDCSGSWSVIEEIQCEHEFDEKQSDVAHACFKQCANLGLLNLVRASKVKVWLPERLRGGSLQPVYSPSKSLPHHEYWELYRKDYDGEGFPDLFSFPRHTTCCEERWDPPLHGYESDDVIQNRVTAYPIKLQTLLTRTDQGASEVQHHQAGSARPALVGRRY